MKAVSKGNGLFNAGGVKSLILNNFYQSNNFVLYICLGLQNSFAAVTGGHHCRQRPIPNLYPIYDPPRKVKIILGYSTPKFLISPEVGCRSEMCLNNFL